MSKISLSEISGISPTIRTFQPSSQLVSPDCVVGIEIEVEQMSSRVSINPELWTVSGDGSLRNNGVEFISAPVFGKDIILALDEFDNVIKDFPDAVINYRCGLHIHLNVSNFTTDQLLSLVCAVALSEEALYRYVGDERRDNIHCLPLQVSQELFKFINDIKYGQTSRRIHDAISNTQKYSGFNILPVLSQGSVEFRQHAGTLDKHKILKWINILQNIREAAIAYDPVALLELDYEQVTEVLFGQYKRELCGEDIARSREGLVRGWVTAKDLLNFNKLKDVYDKYSDVYGDINRVTPDKKSRSK